MICINENGVNKIYECNLLNDILNPSTRAKNLNIHYSPILHGCINTQNGRAKIKKLNPIG